MAENLKANVYPDGTPLIEGLNAGNILDDYSSKYYFSYDNKTWFQRTGSLQDPKMKFRDIFRRDL